MTGEVGAMVVERFRASLLALTGAAPERLGVAVSGGPDSLALLLLASAALPGRVEAATVDHGLRVESAREAEEVAAICADRGVPHAILRLDWPGPPGGNIQAQARNARYAELTRWAVDRGISHLATAHHAEDQAETVLMRLARGAGLGGLAGTRRSRPAGDRGGAALHLVRPLLDWRRAELTAVVEGARLTALDDPSNRDSRFDRTHARALLKDTPWLDAGRFAASAGYLAEAEESLDWAARNLFAGRVRSCGDGDMALNARDLPVELQRRVLLIALERFNGRDDPPPGPKLMRALALIRAGRRCTLAGVQLTGGDTWHLTHAPSRRDLPR